MKIRDLLMSDRLSVSFEIFPPKRPDPSVGEAEAQAALARTKEVVRKIAAERPAFISVTYGAAGGSTGANTGAIARFVQDECGVPALAHLTCIASSRSRIADEVRNFREKGIENILCLRGDRPPGTDAAAHRENDFAHAVDLIRALRPSGFCLGGACYPERHPECAHLADDIAHLKEKVEAGLDFLTTQMFFDNNVYFHYLARLRSADVTIPVLAGIMPVANGRQIDRICKLSGTALPPRFRAIVDRFGDSPDAMQDAGVAYATEQIIDLFANGVSHVHIYTMNRPEIASRIMSNLHGLLA
ncbi:MAG: methylenetetrahydrofolate reductase [Kiritimatiellia bacterium]